MSHDIITASPPQAKKAKTNIDFYYQLIMHVRESQHYNQHQRPGNNSSSTTPTQHGCTRPPSRSASPTRDPTNAQSSIVTPFIQLSPEEEEVLSRNRGSSSMHSFDNSTPSPSQLPSLPFEKTRPGSMSAQNPLELLSNVSSHITKQTSPPTAMKTAKTAHTKNENPQDSYVGERNISGQRHGRGVMKYDNGCRYVGCFVNNKRHGFGKVWYPNGLGVYTGSWRHNKRHGSGTMNFANGDVYTGQWLADQPNGVGMITTMTNGESFAGEFVNRQKHGRGVYKWPNGDIYQGLWVKDVRHGAGSMRPANGDVCRRIYYEGMLLR